MLNYHAHTDFRSAINHRHDPHLTFVQIGDIEVFNGDIYSAIISAIWPFISAIGAISPLSSPANAHASRAERIWCKILPVTDQSG